MKQIMKLGLIAASVAVTFSGSALADVLGDGTLGGAANTDSVIIINDASGVGGGGAGSVTIDGGNGRITTDDGGGVNTVQIDRNGIVFGNPNATINGTAISSFATTSQINALDSKIDSVAKKAYSGIAGVAALAAIPGPAAGKQFSFGVGVGSYAGQQAVAIGGNANFGENINVKAGVGFSDGKTTANAGASFSW